jgi:hypothetical protein
LFISFFYKISIRDSVWVLCVSTRFFHHINNLPLVNVGGRYVSTKHILKIMTLIHDIHAYESLWFIQSNNTISFRVQTARSKLRIDLLDVLLPKKDTTEADKCLL